MPTSTAVLPDRRAASTAPNERFVAFAFAGAELLVEVGPAGTVLFAAGAFRSLFGRPPDSFVGLPLRELAAPSERDTLDRLIALLAERGRLLPTMIRLADEHRTPVAIAGLVIPGQGQDQDRPARLCLSFSRPPSQAAASALGGAPALARAAQTRMHVTAAELGLIEVTAPFAMDDISRDAIGQALLQLAPDGAPGELAAGRFAIVGERLDLPSVAGMLETVLRGQGVEATVNAQSLPLAAGGLSQVQAARALRQALTSFARGGTAGLRDAGFTQGLAGYMRTARAQADALRAAIRGGRFALEYQPIVSLEDRRLHHYEALLRPQALPGSDVADPQEFVSLAETLSLAPELDLAVALTACACAARRRVRVAFNLSSQSAQDSTCRTALIALLEEQPACRAGLISVELTETAEIDAVEEVVRTGEALRALGVPFCLDDFGAGAADIRMLRALRPEIVKLDGAYVAGVTQGGRERAFVAGMVEVAHAAGAAIVAERIETAGEAAAMRQLGVEYGQGWLFGRPAPLPSPSGPAPSAPRTGYGAAARRPVRPNRP